MKYLFFTLLMCFSLTIFSQNISIKGKVEQNGEKISNIEVILYSNENIPLKSILTDNEGTFIFYVNSGNYNIEVRYLGDVLTSKNFSTMENVDLGVLQVDITKKLNEFVFVAKKKDKIIEQKTDRMIFNVENSIMASSGTILDALKATPALVIGNNSISVIGKSSVKVLINDRIVPFANQELQAYLASLSSTEVKSIEVITTPPAKYDAEGNSGLINIVLKKKQSDSWNNQIRAVYFQTSYPALGVTNTFNLKQEKWTVSAAIGANKGYYGSQHTSEIYYPTEVWKDSKSMKIKKDNFSARLGIDYSISPKASIGAIYSGFFADNDEKDWGKTNILNTSPLGEIKNNGFSNKNNNNHAINLHYIQQLDTLGRTISFDIDYFTLKNNIDREFISNRTGNRTIFTRTNNQNDRKIDNYSAKVDVDHPFSTMNLTYGAKITQTKTKNVLNYYDKSTGNPIFDASKSNTFNYTETVQALYVSLEKAFSKQWQAQLGLRLENTQTEGIQQTNNITNKRNYVKLFPSFYLNYKKSKNNIFNFNYSRRISRPSFESLNPFKWYVNPNLYVEGNPFLQPEINDNLELKHIYRNQFISEAYLTILSDGAGQVPFVDVRTQEQHLGRENFYNALIYGVKETILYNPFPWWNTTNVFSLYTMKGRFNNGFNQQTLGTNFLNGWNFQFYTNHSFLLNEEGTLQTELTFMCNAPQTKLTFKTNTYTFVDFGFKALFLDKKLTLTLAAKDIFNDNSPYNTTYTSGIKQIYHDNWDSRRLQIGINYNFGNNKIRIRNKKFGNAEEQNRS